MRRINLVLATIFMVMFTLSPVLTIYSELRTIVTGAVAVAGNTVNTPGVLLLLTDVLAIVLLIAAIFTHRDTREFLTKLAIGAMALAMVVVGITGVFYLERGSIDVSWSCLLPFVAMFFTTLSLLKKRSH